MDTFWRSGYEGTSAQALVDATGLGRGSLYAAYGSKAGLFEQALLRYRKRAQAQVDQLRQPGSPLRRLRELMEDVVDADLKTMEKRGCLATNSAIELCGRDSRIDDLVRSNFSILMRGIEEAIRRGQAEDEICSSASSESLALFLFNAVQGLRVLAKATPSKDRPKLMAIIERTLMALR
ncbi:hypothetical protein BJF93_22965 [Xaviernesmea oryzae]|uniref:HTH tetR-type domain-containing protein n=1 Tax=Xaviernesmea oryzae TaxID=464029 RepID=A0A1Q9AU49_9HYPH|nr:TetR/AcrR family transcriptional regulator [Xaviernesmea oryzae]OLP58957.1 hypothetical protein BJF93_22965 [Xaviernesmea oryzae]